MKALYGLIGHPLGHSISSQIHSRLYQEYGMDAEYRHFDITEQELADTLNTFRQSFRGLNVTIPYKQKIIEYLDETRGDGALFGSVNTILFDQGRAIGYNTDGLGFMKLLQQQGISVTGKEVVVLGAGGAGVALSQKLATEGAKKIIVLNRSVNHAQEAVKRIGQVATCDTGADSLERAGEYVGHCDLLVNTTSVGMAPNTEVSPLTDTESLQSKTAVVDIIYNPGKTKLLQQAEQKGCVAINGLGMLLYQAFYAFELWTGIMPSHELFQQLERELSF